MISVQTFDNNCSNICLFVYSNSCLVLSYQCFSDKVHQLKAVILHTGEKVSEVLVLNLVQSGWFLSEAGKGLS